MNISEIIIDKALDFLIAAISEDGLTWRRFILSAILIASLFIIHYFFNYVNINFNKFIRKIRGLDRIDRLNAEIRKTRTDIFFDIDSCLKKIKERKNHFNSSINLTARQINNIYKEDPEFNTRKNQAIQKVFDLKDVYQENIQDLENSLKKIKKELKAAERLLAEQDRKSRELTSKYYEDPD